VKTVLIVLGTLVLAAALVAGGLWLGSALSRGKAAGVGVGEIAACRALGGSADNDGAGCPMLGNSPGRGYFGRGMMGGPAGGGARDWGMMGSNRDAGTCGPGATTGGPGAACGIDTTEAQGPVTSLEDAKAAVEAYVQSLGYAGLVVKEVMEFEKNYYAIVSEGDTGIGAMELLVDKETGAVGPEQGPNRMWNAKYGMMAGRSGMMGRRGMMGRSTTGEMTVSAEEAGQIAQKWLDENLPGRTAGEADAFYGYYTFHFLKDGQVDGMLSVNGSSGEVWYHNWHGAFVDMIEEGK
jgi:hypothetical protein